MKKIPCIPLLSFVLSSVFMQAQLSGLVTVNPGAPASSTNFQSFTALATALNGSGISGPLTVDVLPNSGPYSEQPQFNVIPGASAANTITINGNSNVLTSSGSNTSVPATLFLDGTDYMYVNSLIVEAGGQANALRLGNGADYNYFSGCTFSSTTAPFMGYSTFVVLLAATTSNYVGNSGNGNTWFSCSVMGGGNGIGMYSQNAAPFNHSNSVINCDLKDWMLQGIRADAQQSVTVSGCSLRRPASPNNGPTSGIYFRDSKSIKCSGNCIKDLYNINQGAPVWGGGQAITYQSSLTVTPLNEFSDNVIIASADNYLNYGFYLTPGNVSCTGNSLVCVPNASIMHGFYQFYTFSGDSLRILDNYISLLSPGSSAMSIGSHTNTIVEYNRYYIAQGSYINNTSVSSFQAWQGMGYDAQGTFYSTDPNLQITSACGTFINTAPVSSFSCAPLKCANETVAITDLSSNSPTAWSWSVTPGTGVSFSTTGSQNPQAAFSSPGSYTISLSASNSGGAGNTYTQSITISDCTGLKPYGNDRFKVYPNPSIGQITIETASGQPHTFSVVNALGEIVFRKTAHAAKEDLDLSHLPKGIYFLKIENEEGSGTIKIVRD